MRVMALPVPTSLSPSRVDAFTSCPLAFRFASIDRLPEPPSIHTTRGSLVHRILELLFCRPPQDRTPASAQADLAQAMDELRADDEYALLGLDDEGEAGLVADAERLVERYFTMEDPRTVLAIGLELRLDVEVGGLQLRGIIDRLELDTDGGLVVTDYKTGRPPMVNREQQRLGGVHFYAYLCERIFGRRPARIQLLYLSTGEVIETRPSEQSVRFLPRRTEAVYQAVVRACATEDFRPKTGPLCGFCAFKAWCPAFGGDPTRAALEAPLVLGRKPAAESEPALVAEGELVVQAALPLGLPGPAPDPPHPRERGAPLAIPA
jgi:putative RecB family exonuclease